MKEINSRDIDLLEAIRQGNPKGWSQLVEQYQGRLLNFARSRLPQQADAEDVVQNTFISFIRNVEKLKCENCLESYLFSILRNQICDLYRTKHAKSVCLIQDIYSSDSDERSFDFLPENTTTPSEYIWRDEQKEVLAEAIYRQLSQYKKTMKFSYLKIVDLLFYAGISNKNTATLLNKEPKTVGVIKHRFIKQLREDITNVYSPTDLFTLRFEGMLTEIWESHQLSCPKRSTLGAFLLEKLDAKWFDYVDFHVTILGCHFCRANLKDLINEKNADYNRAFQERIIASTVGFFTKS